MRLRGAPGAEEELTEAAQWYEARRVGLFLIDTDTTAARRP
jgi:hypothetical protein